jgi:hypothetical protein
VFFDPRGGTHFEGRWEAPVEQVEARAEAVSDGSAETPVRDNGSRGLNRDTPRNPGDLVEHLLAESQRRGVQPDAWTPSARWKREGDIPEEVLFRAGEALMG